MAKTVPEFEQHMENFRKIDNEAFKWLMEHTEPRHWVDCYFEGHRYGHYTSNIAEATNAWLLDAREQPLQPMLETIRDQLMGWFDNRREEGAKMRDGGFVPKISTEIRKAMDTARSYICRHAIDLIYEIKSLQSSKEYC